MCSIKLQVLPGVYIVLSVKFGGGERDMGFDIYGNHLRPGYCEVHPDVPEEYPCRLCHLDKEESKKVPVSRFQIFRILHDSNLNQSQKGDRIVALLKQAGVDIK